MTQYLSTMTLEEMDALTLEELAALIFDALASYTIHSPFAVGNANDYTSLYIVTNAEDYAT